MENGMLSGANAKFWLMTSTKKMEVAQFSIKQWGISREYAIDVVVYNPSYSPRLAEMVCLQIDNETFFHARISAINTSYSHAIHQLNLHLTAPLTFCLQHVQTRIYHESSLAKVMHQVLQEAGLLPGIDYEFHFSNIAEQPIWLQQLNESSFEFLNRLMFHYQIQYVYRQDEKGICCLFSDNLTALLPARAAKKWVFPLGEQLVSEHHLYHTKLAIKPCPKGIRAGVYCKEQAQINASNAFSHHDFAKGRLSVNGQVPDKVATGIQHHFDEKALVLSLSLAATAVQPGQSVVIHSSVLPKTPYRVSEMSLYGFNEQAIGSKNALNNRALQQEHLRVDVHLTADFSGQVHVENPVEANRTSSFHLAVIEHPIGPYPDISAQGEYHLRLHHDEALDTKQQQFSPLAHAHASGWVRQALYFAGSCYGLNYPFQEGTEVLIGYENGRSEQPLILGTILGIDHNPSVVTSANVNDHVLCSVSGNALRMVGDANERLIELKTVEEDNTLRLKQKGQETAIDLLTTKGSMTLEAQDKLTVATASHFLQESKQGQHVWAEGPIQYQSEGGHLYLSSDEDVSLHCGKSLHIQSKEQRWVGGKTFTMHAQQQLLIKATQTLQCSATQGELNWHLQKGRLVINARQSMTIKSQTALLMIRPEAIVLKTDKGMTLQAKVIPGIERLMNSS